jgi:hypothetical protein
MDVGNRVVLVTDAGIQIIGRNHMIRFIVVITRSPRLTKRVRTAARMIRVTRREYHETLLNICFNEIVCFGLYCSLFPY